MTTSRLTGTDGGEADRRLEMTGILSARQEAILSRVVDGYLQSGQPVASRVIAADPELECSPSTVRHELALLEAHGLLAHPHTSAGRVPTEAGQRYVVDRMLFTGQGLAPPGGLELSLIQREVEEAMKATTAALSKVTNLLAVVSAPSMNNATVRHVEVLALQPTVVMAVVITSTGGVFKMVVNLRSAVDPGLVAWAGEYLNERLVGLTVGARMIHQRLTDPTLPSTERAFLLRFAPAFADICSEGEDALFVDGTARLFSHDHVQEAAQIDELLGMLERRVALLNVLRTALDAPDVYVRIGRENEIPAMRSLAMVASSYGVARRRLGTVSVIGPVRMDYAAAIPTVRDAALQLSRFIENTYLEA